MLDTELRIKAVEMAIKFFEGTSISDLSKKELYLRETYSEIFLFISNAQHSKFQQKVDKHNGN